MKVKKLIPLCGVALFSVAALASCGNNGGNGGGAGNGKYSAKITIWAASQEIPVINKVIGKYNKSAAANNATQIAYETFVVEEDKTSGQLIDKPNAKDAADLLLTVDDSLLSLKRANLLVSLDGKIGDKLKNDMTEDAITSVTIENSIYGYPICTDNSYVLFYDKRFYSEEEAKSFNTILEKAKNQSKTVYMDIENGFYVNSFLMAEGIAGLDSMSWKKNEKNQYSYVTNWDTPEVAAKVEKIHNLVGPYHTSNTLKGGKDNVVDSDMNKGMVAAITGVWKENTLREKLGDNLGVTKLPTFEIEGDATKHQMAAFKGSKVYVINKNSTGPKKQAAAKVAELLTGKTGQLYRFQMRNINPCNKAAIAHSAYADHITIGGRAVLDQAPYACFAGAAACDKRYWDTGRAIGKAIKDGQLGVTGDNPWLSFMQNSIEPLKQPQ